MRNMQNNIATLTISHLDLKNMFGQFMKINTPSSLSSGTLPSNTVPNPKEELKGITTRSGLSYTQVPPIPPPLFDETEPVIEKEIEVTKDPVLKSTENIQPPVIQTSQVLVKPTSIPIPFEPSSAQVDNSFIVLPKKPHLPNPQRMNA